MPTNVPIFEEWIGTLDGYVNAKIHAQVTGYLLTQNYAEGSEVKKGDLLFQIDPRPFQATLDQARAKLAQDQAQSGKTELDVKRYTPLAKEQAISQEELDNAVQANLAAKAQVEADEAAIENAQLNLDFTQITSPMDGLAGIALAQIGDLVGQSGSVLTTVSTINPIKVYFQISEQSYLNFWRHHAAGSGAETNVELQLIFADGSVYPATGKVFLRRPAGQSQHRHAANRRAFSQPELHSAPRPIRPGARANADRHQCAAGAATRGDGTAGGLSSGGRGRRRTPCTCKTSKSGEQIGANWIIESGLKPGDRVVVEGTQKVKEGTVVNPKPFTDEPIRQMKTIPPAQAK